MEGNSSNDKAEIINCVLDYVEGWYCADSNRMNMALSSKLVKRRILSENESWDVTKEWMVNATNDGNGKIENPQMGKKEITVFDSTLTMASVKLTSEKFNDYLHLSKIDGKWKIVNALWDFVAE